MDRLEDTVLQPSRCRVVDDDAAASPADRADVAPRAVEEELTLYRPTGPEELALVAASGYRRWPPRLEGQPFFYPVTNQRYAEEIAQRWNVRASGQGFVTRFAVETAYLTGYPVRCVGAEHHTEHWIPAEELEEFNDQIVGLIDVVHISER